MIGYIADGKIEVQAEEGDFPFAGGAVMFTSDRLYTVVRDGWDGNIAPNIAASIVRECPSFCGSVVNAALAAAEMAQHAG